MKRDLTARELAVLEGAARGELSRETAARLGMSPETARKVRSRVILKMGAKNVTHAVAIHAREKAS